jgi:hypothetical protein
MACIANATTEPEAQEAIAVTPKMLKAGGNVVATRSGYGMPDDALAFCVFEAMIRESPKFKHYLVVESVS